VRRQVIVSWAGNPLVVHVLSSARPVRVGAGPDADVILPVEATLHGEGETTLGEFTVSVTDTTSADRIRSPWRVGRGLGTLLGSALFHAIVLAGAGALVGGTARADAGTTGASQIDAMRGYLARSAAHATSAEPVVAPAHPSVANDAPVAPSGSATSAASTSGAHVRGTPVKHTQPWSGEDRVAGLGPSRGSVRGGEWVGTYMCLNQVYGLVVHIDSVRGDDFRLLGKATSPLGIDGTYRQHGHRDPASGVARFLPDGWVGAPIPDHHIAGMHGRFAGDRFEGAIDDPACGEVHLRRHVG